VYNIVYAEYHKRLHKRYFTYKKKTTPSGWTSFNAPCCHHNGESPDTRGRGGLTANPDGSVSFHCFNCNFKARDLPESAVSFRAMMTHHLLDDFKNVPGLLNSAVNYTNLRKINYDRYDFYWTDSTEHSLHQRVIIPFIWQGRIIGYTARAVTDGVKPKYYSNYEPNFVFNINNQLADSKFVIVCEGPFDAMSMDGVAVLNNECNETQADIIESLGREVIVVADKDRAGAKMINNAIEYGWTVSFPVWLETCKDVNEAVVKYGKLFVLKTILDAKQTSKLKIELMKKKLYN